MNYTFPQITHIDQVRNALVGRTEFKFVEKDDYTWVDYLVNLVDTFPPIDDDDENLKIRRECRGIIFNTASGEIIRRPLHKFFNWAERPEVGAGKIDFSRPHHILYKMDGSMLSPFMSNGKLRFGTKKGYTDIAAPVEDWVAQHPHYLNFSEYMVNMGYTPIYEWCSRKQRIVIDYPNDRLVLTAVRHMKNGFYMPYGDMQKYGQVYNIEVVEMFDSNSITDINAFAQKIRATVGLEGVVVRFEDGHMIKLKGDEYCLFHKSLDIMKHEKEVVRMIAMNKLDDAMPVMSPENRERAQKFNDDFIKNVVDLADTLKWVVIEAKDNLGESARKRFALEIVPKHQKILHSLLFKIWEGHDPYEQLMQKIAQSTSNQAGVDENRALFGGIKWWNYGVTVDENSDDGE